MVKITVSDLHSRTDHWVRKAAGREIIIITDDGRPVATLTPFEPEKRGIRFSERQLLPEFAALKPVEGDSTFYISDDRDRL